MSAGSVGRLSVDEGEEQALRDIEEYGCHVIHVLAEGESPPFSYSVGIQKAAGRPECVVIGLKQPIAHFVVNEYNRRVRAGDKFVPGEYYAGFIEGFDVLVETVEREFYREYFGWDLWLYDGANFEVLQIIYPTTDGVWPWECDEADWFRTRQPLLTRNPLTAIPYEPPN